MVQERLYLGRRQRRHLQIRNQIRQAAEQVILEKGYGKTSIKDIMDHTELGYATFYNYYRSKKDVVMDIVAENIEMARQGVKWAPPDEDNLHVRVYTSLLSALEIFHNSKNMWKIVRSGLEYDTDLRRVWTEATSNIFDFVHQEGIWSERWGLLNDGVSLDTVLIVVWGTIESTRSYVLDNDLTMEELQRMTWEYSLMIVKAVFKVDHIPPELMQHVRRGLRRPTIVNVDTVDRNIRRRSKQSE
ncbi:MAG: TetR/AcrR family transcriptional regulator [Candidatus Saccharibacteria bacterium]